MAKTKANEETKAKIKGNEKTKTKSKLKYILNSNRWSNTKKVQRQIQGHLNLEACK